MKYLTDRHEIAMALNFNKYPVIHINLEDEDEYGVKGTKVRVAYKDLLLPGTFRSYSDEPNKFSVSSGATCLSSSFGYRDVIEDVAYANTPILKADQEIVIVLDKPSQRSCWVCLTTTGNHINPHCMTMLTVNTDF